MQFCDKSVGAIALQATSVKCLLMGRGPVTVRCPAMLRAVGAVATRIVAIVVATVHGVAGRWPWAKIGVEGGERMYPSLAHTDAASTVPLVCRNVGVGRTCFDSGPDAMFGLTTHGMRCQATDREFTAQAATTVCDAASQGCSVNDSHVPTFAEALPSQWYAGDGVCYCQPPVNVSDQVDATMTGLPSFAATTGCQTMCNGEALSRYGLSTITLAKPARPSVGAIFGSGENSQLVEALSRQIDRLHMLKV